MNIRLWAIYFLAGVVLNVADFWLTVQLLESHEFFEGNFILRWFFEEGHYLSVFLIKTFGWALVMFLALHPKIQRWLTIRVLRISTIGLATIVGWNVVWYINLIS